MYEPISTYINSNYLWAINKDNLSQLRATCFLGALCQMSTMNIQIMFTLIRKNNDGKQWSFFKNRIFIIQQLILKKKNQTKKYPSGICELHCMYDVQNLWQEHQMWLLYNIQGKELFYGILLHIPQKRILQKTGYLTSRTTCFYLVLRWCLLYYQEERGRLMIN